MSSPIQQHVEVPGFGGAKIGLHQTDKAPQQRSQGKGLAPGEGFVPVHAAAGSEILIKHRYKHGGQKNFQLGCWFKEKVNREK